MHTRTSEPADRSRQNLIGLAVHAAAFLFVGAAMVAVNFATSPDVLWFSWSLFGWGIGLAMHTVGVLHFETLGEGDKRAYLEREAARRLRYQQRSCGRGCGCGHLQVGKPHLHSW